MKRVINFLFITEKGKKAIKNNKLVALMLKRINSIKQKDWGWIAGLLNYVDIKIKGNKISSG